MIEHQLNRCKGSRFPRIVFADKYVQASTIQDLRALQSAKILCVNGLNMNRQVLPLGAPSRYDEGLRMR